MDHQLCYVDVEREPGKTADRILAAYDAGRASWIRAATILNVSRRTLVRWCEVLGIARKYKVELAVIVAKHAPANHDLHVLHGRRGAEVRRRAARKSARDERGAA